MLNVLRRFVGDDIFISYSRRDALDYALALARRLNELGFSCRLDAYGTSVGSELPRRLFDTIRGSYMMVVLGTPGAASSTYIRVEVEEFLKLGKPIILVDFDGALHDAEWAPLIEGHSWTTEPEKSLRDGTPSGSVIYQIEDAFRFARRNRRLRRASFQVMALLLLLLAAMGVLSAYALSLARRVQLLQGQVSAAATERLSEVEARLAEKNREAEQLNSELSASRSEANRLRMRLANAEHSTAEGDPDLRQRVDDLNGQLVARNDQVDDLSRQLSQKAAEADTLSAQLQKEKAVAAGLAEALGRRPVKPEETKSPQETSWVGFALLAGVLVAALYLCACALLLFTRPLWILRLHERLSPEKVSDAGDWGGGAKLAKLILTAVGVNYFVKHRRTRQAWLTQYKLGESKFGDLPEPIRTVYIKYDNILDAWVERNRKRAAEAIERVEFVRQRKLFVDLPIEVKPEGRLIARHFQQEFRYLFDPDREMVVEIVGRGGSGKSTLAAQFARWALDPNPAGGLGRHLMIPVVILHAVSKDIIEDVTAGLRRMFGAENDLDKDLNKDLVRALLRRKRLLVIIDGVSERSPETREAVRDIFGKEYVGALVITSRTVLDFEARPMTVLTPRYFTGADLENFISGYFNETGVHVDLSLRQMEEVKRAVTATFRNRASPHTLTPLIVTLIADHAVELWRQRVSLSNLSASTADAIAAYLQRVNPKDEGTPNRVPDDIMLRAARVLAKFCLGDMYTPKDFDRAEAHALLREAGCDGQPSDVIARLMDNGVLGMVAHAGTSFLSFDIDTVAEYLAAMYVLHDLRDNKAGWETWLRRLRHTRGYPDDMQGFLAAMEDCVDSHRDHFRVPRDVEFPRLEPQPERAVAEPAGGVKA
jgi:uncharacterized coiled-coil protein SlyX